MSLQKETQIQIRCSKHFKQEVKEYCDRKDIKISVYIYGLIKNDLNILPPSAPLEYGKDWVL